LSPLNGIVAMLMDICEKMWRFEKHSVTSFFEKPLALAGLTRLLEKDNMASFYKGFYKLR
jgi:hypothetical protein